MNNLEIFFESYFKQVNSSLNLKYKYILSFYIDHYNSTTSRANVVLSIGNNSTLSMYYGLGVNVEVIHTNGPVVLKEFSDLLIYLNLLFNINSNNFVTEIQNFNSNNHKTFQKNIIL